ncbi:MAG: hypothetical protein ACR2MA_03775 [Egibacteraceae bacterium]
MDALPPEVTDDLTRLLRACPAFLGVEETALRGLAARAEILYLAHPRHAGDVGTALVVERGSVLVRDAEGRSVDLVGEGEFAAPDGEAVLEPVEESLLVVLTEGALVLAWSAPAEQLRAAHAADRAVVDLETAAVRTVMSAPVQTISGGRTAARLPR